MIENAKQPEPSAEKLTIAVLGTGTMGAAMARNLLGAGYRVRVWNRSSERAAPLAADGASVCATPAQAADGATFLLTTLWDSASVAAAASDALPSLAAGGIWLQASTVGLAGARTLAVMAAEHGVNFVDLPVVGTKGPAEQGTLVVLASGEDALRARVAPVLDVIGARTIWVAGDLAASKLKLVVNSWVLALIEGIAESVRLAEHAGIDPQLFLDAIAGGPTDSQYVQIKGKAMIDRQFPPSFRLSGALKDADLILDAAREVGLQMVGASVARDQVQKAVSAGHGDADMAAIYHAEDSPGSAASSAN
jgi:3-hydroxyisobutyrate dehydrogenase